jgi:protein gp37
MSLKIATATGAHWNPWMGCHKIRIGAQDGGCLNCYMYREMHKFHPRWNPNKVRKSKSLFDSPLHMKGHQLIFTPSWSDFFLYEADNLNGEKLRDKAWSIIRSSDHVFRICTKRINRVTYQPQTGTWKHLPKDWCANGQQGYPNVWLGITIEHQKYVSDLNRLRQIPCALRWVSAEPLLSPLPNLNLNGISFVVAGGESGPNPRSVPPANLDWFRDLRDQCKKAGVYFLLKQLGGSKKCTCHRLKNPTAPNSPFHEPGFGCRILDGRVHDQIPPW